VPENGYFFSSPLADYFLIGGAWSGLLIGEEFENDWRDNGRDCDAQLVTEALYETFLKPFEGAASWDTDFVDLDRDEVSPAFIGGKWVCVIDYHQ